MCQGTDHITLCVQVSRIFEQPRTADAAERFIETLKIELHLMFPAAMGSQSTAKRSMTAKDRRELEQVCELESRLGWFARMVTTLRNASGLIGVAENVLSNARTRKRGAADPECALLNLSLQLINLSKDTEQPLQLLATLSERFDAALEPHTEALAAADQLGDALVSGLLRFLREVIKNDDDLRDLAQEADEQADIGDAVLSLVNVHTVLKPLLKRPPTRLHGGADGMLEQLREQLLANSMQGLALRTCLEECIAHLHALKQTYDNLTKKGEQSTEMRRAVVERGVFVFSARQPPHVLCDGKLVLSEAKLRELRSHALLEINSSRGEVVGAAPPPAEREQLTTFLEVTKLASSIGGSISRLVELGYFEPVRFEQQVRGRYHGACAVSKSCI